MMNSAGRFIRRRPLSFGVSSSIVGVGASGYYVENRIETKAAKLTNEKFLDDLTTTEESGLLLPRNYERDLINQYWNNRPVTALNRVTQIGSEVLPCLYAYARDFYFFPKTEEGEVAQLQTDHAKALRAALTRLGPAFIKFGQQLSIRPDILPPLVLKELQKLCDKVEPVEFETAMNTIREELGEDWNEKVEELELVASASLGQVYKVQMKSGEVFAMKVQRPDMARRVSLDVFLLNSYGALADSLSTMFTEQVPYHADFIDCFAMGSYNELDYEKEAKNQNHFKDEFAKRESEVHIPTVNEKMTSRRVITMEWVEGVKLADAEKEVLRKLIPVGVELFLTQLLDMGKFHADPHPGNLYVTRDGTLCLLDFGLCADIDERARSAMTKSIVHLLSGDFESLIAKDAIELGFLPHDYDTKELKPILTKILTQGLLEPGSNLHARKRKLMSISNELNEVFFRYPFSVPPFFALITRGLGLLEGIALSGDPDFDIFKASYPYARKRAAQMYGFNRWKTRENKL